MKALIDRRIFVDTASKVCSAIEKPSLNAAKLEAREGAVVITATGNDGFTVVPVPAKIAEEGEFAIDLGYLGGLLDSSREATFEMRDDPGSGKVAIKCGSSKWNLKQMDARAYPTWTLDPKAEYISIPPGLFESMATRVMSIIKTTANIYEYALLSFNEAKVVMVGTNGHELMEVSEPFEGSKKTASLTLAGLRTLAKIAANAAEAEQEFALSIEERHIAVRTGQQVAAGGL